MEIFQGNPMSPTLEPNSAEMYFKSLENYAEYRKATLQVKVQSLSDW